MAFLVAASLGIGYLAENPGLQAAHSTSTSRQTTVSTSIEESSTISGAAISTVSSSGLELRVDLNTTAMEPGRTLAANLTLFNTLNESLSLPLSAQANLTNQIAAWNNDDFACGIGGLASYVAAFALFRGHVSADNLSLSPDPLQLASIVQLCDVYLAFTEDESMVFLPHSANASIPTAYPIVSPITLNAASGLFGYWNRTSYTCCDMNANAPNLFRYFIPGEYTLAAEDLWGDRVFAYFQVTPGPSPSLAVAAQESPFSSPESPEIGLTLANFGDVPITSLNATLRFIPPPGILSLSVPYPFRFSVNSSAPLLPGQTVEETRTLSGGSMFDIGVSYPLTISGVFSNGTTFTYAQQVWFTNSVPSW